MDGAFKMAEMSLKSTEISSKPSTIETRICRINILKTAINEIEQKNSSADNNFNNNNYGDDGGNDNNTNDKMHSLRAAAQYHQAIGNEMLGIGNVNESIDHFKLAFDYYLNHYENNYISYTKEEFDHLDTCAVFYTECLEHSCLYIFDAIDILINKIFFNENINHDLFLKKHNDDNTTTVTYTIYQKFPISTLLLLKLLYISPVYYYYHQNNKDDNSSSNNNSSKYSDNKDLHGYGPKSIDMILKLITEIEEFSNNLKVEIKRRFKSHWAFFLFIQALIKDEVYFDNNKNANKNDKRNKKKKSNNNKKKKNITKDSDKLTVFYISNDRRTNKEEESNICNEKWYTKMSLFTNPIVRWQELNKLNTIPYPPLFVIGDSHTLTYGWRSLSIHSEKRTCIPILITGIKAWHFRKNTQFYTYTALHNALQEIHNNSSPKELIISAGEIDVREGIGRALDKGHYKTLKEAIEETVREYISELVDISIKYSLSLYILPVPPHAKRPSKRGRWRNRQRRRKACTLFNDSLRKQCATCKNINNATLHYLDFIDDLYIVDDDVDAGYNNSATTRGNEEEVAFNNETRVLNPIYDSDKTHLNRKTLSLLQSSLDRLEEVV